MLDRVKRHWRGAESRRATYGSANLLDGAPPPANADVADFMIKSVENHFASRKIFGVSH